MLTNDARHTWKLLIDGVDYTQYLDLKQEITWSSGEGGRTSTFDFVINYWPFAIWKEVQWISDPNTAFQQYQFGGYIIRPEQERRGATTRIRSRIHCEGYNIRLGMARVTPRIYLGWTPGAILQDMWANAGLTDFDFSQASEGTTLDQFAVAADEGLTSAMDRLALLSSGGATPWTWGIGGDKRVWFKAASNFAAPFRVIDGSTSADSSHSQYIEKGTFSAKRSGEGVYNRIRVEGGETVSNLITETFAGSDGFVDDNGDRIFTLAHTQVADFVSIVAHGNEYVTPTTFGLDWYSTDPGLLCFGQKSMGTIRFEAGEVASGDTVVVQYRYRTRIAVTRTNASLYNSIKFWIDGPTVQDPAITSEAAAIAYGDALLAAHTTMEVSGEFTVWRLGLQPGQHVEILVPTYDIVDNYTIRKVTHRLTTVGALVKCDVQFASGNGNRLADYVASPNVSSQATAYGAPAPAQVEGEAGIMRFRDRWEALAPGTQFGGWNNYGNASGVVGGVDRYDGLGKVLGLLNGLVQSYFGGDGRFYSGGGNIIIDRDGLTIYHDTSTQTGYGLAGYGVVGYGGVTAPTFKFTKLGSSTRFALFRLLNDNLAVGYSANAGSDGYPLRWLFVKNGAFQLAAPTTAPATPAAGQIAWADGVNWNPTGGAGVYAYNGSGWERLSPDSSLTNIPHTAQTLVDAASISWNLNSGGAATVTLAGNRTLANPTNMKNGGSYYLVVKQDGTGNRTLSYGTAYKFPNNIDPVLSTPANAVDILTFISDGTSMYGVAQTNFQ